MYQKVSTNLNFVEREKQTEEFWRKEDIFTLFSLLLILGLYRIFLITA